MNRIKDVLKEKGIKQTGFAEKIDKSFSQTNAYVCNRRQAILEQLFGVVKIEQKILSLLPQFKIE